VADLTPQEQATYLDRMWMQDDHLHIRSRDSGEVSVDRYRRNANEGNLRFVAPREGNLVSSMVQPGFHRPVLDLDIPHMYVPSSTPGHGHLYLNGVFLNDSQHFAFISSLVHFNVLGEGSLAQVKAQNMSLVRAMHIRKGSELEHPIPDVKGIMSPTQDDLIEPAADEGFDRSIRQLIERLKRV
jgi:hypothetical protein